MRAFVGTLLSDDIQAAYRALTGNLISSHNDVLRSIPESSAHLTYAFLGDIDEARELLVREAIRSIAVRHAALQIGLGPPHVLWAGRTPRLVCADVSIGAEGLRRLADSLLSMLRPVPGRNDLSGMKSAHVTLARFRRQASRVDAKAVEADLGSARYASESPTDRIQAIQLIASTLTPAGPRYHVVESYPLAGG